MNNDKNPDRDAFDVIRGKLWWPKDDVARIFNVSRKTVFNWMQRRLTTINHVRSVSGKSGKAQTPVSLVS
jgi:hypothetical protein